MQCTPDNAALFPIGRLYRGLDNFPRQPQNAAPAFDKPGNAGYDLVRAHCGTVGHHCRARPDITVLVTSYSTELELCASRFSCRLSVGPPLEESPDNPDMGNCFGSEQGDTSTQPSTEERRKIMAEAAQKRQAQSQNRGLSGPGAAERIKKKQSAVDRANNNPAPSAAPGMQWTVS